MRSVELRMPSFSMSLGRYVNTGFGPTSSAVGMFEPVTITRSTSAAAGGGAAAAPGGGGGGGGGVWGSAFAAENKGDPTVATTAAGRDSKIIGMVFIISFFMG